MPVDPAADHAPPLLPYDTARCSGTDAQQCIDCLRRTAPGNPHGQWHMAPPDSIRRGDCSSRIKNQTAH